MVTAPVSPHESARLSRLRELKVLDTAPEPIFDALVRAASLVVGTPIALVSLIDADRQWFKANHGLKGAVETPLEAAFCTYAILGDAVFEVPDATADPRFANNPLVTGAPDIRFYAGAPITLSNGMTMGTLCVIDQVPRHLTDTQRLILKELAHAAALALEQRAAALERDDTLSREVVLERQLRHTAQEWEVRLRASEGFLHRTGAMAGVGGWEIELATGSILWSAQTCRIHDLQPGYQPTLDEMLAFYPQPGRETLGEAFSRAVAESTGWDLELPLVTAAGRPLWVRIVGHVEPAGGPAQRLVGAVQDTTDRRRAIAAVESSERRFRKLFHYSLGLICTHDLDGVLLSVNPAAASSLGYTVADVMGRPMTDFLRPAAHRHFEAYLRRVVQHGTDSGHLELVGRDGASRIWAYHNVLDQDGDETYVLGHAQDVTEQQKNERQLREWSLRDPLTHCYNRRFLSQLAGETTDETLGLITIDLDRFKAINDTYGHQRGDDVLVEMARYLSAHTRTHDAVVRLGGDEFLIVLRAASNVLLQSVSTRLAADAADAPIAFTLGLSLKAPGIALETAIEQADRRLYEARAGRPGQTSFSPP
ncbi:diguanylate cyclase (GGDEF)-like protein/PAS domain S-box-containing protein [Luteibacter sp. Sphag1AF]|uniref:sensor domain-containing diguanylate cyclase n=1 Tax=Luteibacter sp. Sphag1AF TaxID=2587031 RepID=UPI0016200D11|nr:diguanylate cyclase [Luteibacter sp. Sphag1AF]MBB3228595.1 diguanylate cyclase (GGDEF)-like protein/PAS domain S-box-containing protein [Luteibacter sp. Sphag1AF]